MTETPGFWLDAFFNVAFGGNPAAVEQIKWCGRDADDYLIELESETEVLNLRPNYELAPYWAARLNKTLLQAEQLSARGGKLEVELKGERVYLRGESYILVKGLVRIPSK